MHNYSLTEFCRKPDITSRVVYYDNIKSVRTIAPNFYEEKFIMFCRNCGSQIDDSAVFCPHCGVATNNYNAAPAKSQTNAIAIVGFILSFFIPIAGLICSIIGYKNAGDYENQYKGFALAGIIISIVELALSVIAIVVYVLILASLITGYGVYI